MKQVRRFTVDSETKAGVMAYTLIEIAAWFECRPMSGGEYRFTVEDKLPVTGGIIRLGIAKEG